MINYRKFSLANLLISYTKDIFDQMNLRQSAMNGLLTFVFRLISLIMIPFTLKITSSDEYASMAITTILFQLVSTIFIGSIQRKIYESRSLIFFYELRHTFFANSIFFVLLTLIVNLAVFKVTWISLVVINLGLIEAFTYSIFNGWYISFKLKTGDFRTIRLIQSYEFILIGPFRLITLYLLHSLIIWAALGVIIRVSQLALTRYYFAKYPKVNNELPTPGRNLIERSVSFDYSIINITFWGLLNSAPLMSLSMATSSYIEALQVSIAVAGILGTILTQISNALVPLYLKNSHPDVMKKMQRQFIFLTLSSAILGTPLVLLTVSHILSNSIESYLQLTIIYILINFLFGFISLFQVFSYGSKSRTVYLRNGCLASLSFTLIIDIYNLTNRTFSAFPYSSLVGFLILTVHLFIFRKFHSAKDSKVQRF